MPELLAQTRQLHPVSSIETTIGSSVSAQWRAELGDIGAMSHVLSQVDVVRLLEGSTAYWVAVMGSSSGFAGIGQLGRSAGDFGPGTHVSGIRTIRNAPLAHELAHNMGRKHAPCGNPLNPDSTYPHPGAIIGVSGADLYTWSVNGTFPVEIPSTTFDLMSYCGPRWISDYTFDAMLRWRITEDSALRAMHEEPPQTSLIVWGAVSGDSIRLEPSFTAETRPALPRRPGSYVVSGRDWRGTLLFSVSFDPAPLDHGDERPFLFAIPVSDAQQRALARLSVAGEGRSGERLRVPASFLVQGRPPAARTRFVRLSAGRSSVTWDTKAAPLVIAREPLTGRVLGIGTSGSMTLSTATDRVELLLSDGLGSTVTTLTRR
jgi:hypothetical protein